MPPRAAAAPTVAPITPLDDAAVEVTWIYKIDVTFRLVPERRAEVVGKATGRGSMMVWKVGQSATVPVGRRVGQLTCVTVL